MTPEDSIDLMKKYGIIPIDNTTNIISIPTYQDTLIEQRLLITQLNYKLDIMHLFLSRKISEEERISLMKQLNSVDPEAIVLAQETINNLIKEL